MDGGGIPLVVFLRVSSENIEEAGKTNPEHGEERQLVPHFLCFLKSGCDYSALSRLPAMMAGILWNMSQDKSFLPQVI